MHRFSRLYNGDCLEIMRNIPDRSVDFILCDLPYGTTACKWDTVIPFELLWAHYKRIIKPYHAIVLFGTQPFTTALISSNLQDFKYTYVWKKSKAANFMHAKNMPLKLHEDICVFSNGAVTHEGQSLKRMPYFPQGVTAVDKIHSRPNFHNSEHRLRRPSHKLSRRITQEGFPGDVLEYNSVHNPPHPTQKPVALLEHLIKTYTEAAEVVLDNCMGAGSTGVACANTGRRFIGIELERKYFDIASERIADAFSCAKSD